MTAAGAVPPISETFRRRDLGRHGNLPLPDRGSFRGTHQIHRAFRPSRGSDLESATPSFRVTVTNPANGQTLRDADVGLDKFTPTPDGGDVVLSTGIHFRVLTGEGGPIFTRIGLQLIIITADGSVEIQEIGGNFDPIEDFQRVVCDFLADI